MNQSIVPHTSESITSRARAQRYFVALAGAACRGDRFVTKIGALVQGESALGSKAEAGKNLRKYVLLDKLRLDVGEAGDVILYPAGFLCRRSPAGLFEFEFEALSELYECCSDAWGCCGGGGGFRFPALPIKMQ
jgi:hypothetical protein